MKYTTLIFITIVSWLALSLSLPLSVYAVATVTLSPASGNLSSNVTTIKISHNNPSGEEITVIQFDLAYSGNIKYSSTTASGNCALLTQPSGNPLLISFITCTPALSSGTTHTLGTITWTPDATGKASLAVTNVDDGFKGADIGGTFSYDFTPIATGTGTLPDTGLLDLTDLWSIGLLMLSLGVVISVWGDNIMLRVVGVKWFEKKVSASA